MYMARVGQMRKIYVQMTKLNCLTVKAPVLSQLCFIKFLGLSMYITLKLKIFTYIMSVVRACVFISSEQSRSPSVYQSMAQGSSLW